jgi:hypothetical protein
MEKALKERESDFKCELDQRLNELKIRYESDIDKLKITITRLENDNQLHISTIKQYETEKHQYDIRMVELNEALKTEKVTVEKKIE